MNFQEWKESQKSLPPPSSLSKQERFDKHGPNYEDSYEVIRWISNRSDNLPAYGSQARQEYLREFWKAEAILSGAVYSSTAKILGLGWTVSGGRNLTIKYSNILREADGSNWTNFLSKFLQDYLTTDRGAFIELGYRFKGGPVEGIFNLDSIVCRDTGNYNYPVKYETNEGDWHTLPREAVIHAASMPSPANRHNNEGYCAVSRAIQAARILILLATYEQEKLSDLPPNGIAAVTGLSPRQFKDALRMWKDERMNKGDAVYPGILWLIGNPGPGGGPGKVSIDLTSFSGLPDQFDKKVTVDIYAKTLALAFGVDVNEFWQIEHVGATKASAWIQAQKAKGKFPAVIISLLERAINLKVLPPGVVFKFQLQDDEDKLGEAELHRAMIDNIMAMRIGDKPPITEDEARQLLVINGILPPEFGGMPREVAGDVQSKMYSKNSSDYIEVNHEGNIVFNAKKLFPGV
ncbi:hypothetical protein KKH23_07995 [Patescibacteria group bacterium]|nr:hypothetical protein [Patescibacteria group bacterium]